ncbi:MarR family winged helix-turn-helix transcriptional regulator [Polaromonas sp. SM01]|uniref:MarR family winged helix-turn-helix transcriptional regulator n=1 Tax=Polaromonas sp. SM01 TaxID=3085630 RepID=UPI0029825D7B|nr:MarR family winged helix-turn-helix transcriptional regulator [Polaromonas sp. SM01]MDW5441092.1 MarR family winged helix-turn-helix transcriptional regulator [Polaromonas sp. SM01]
MDANPAPSPVDEENWRLTHLGRLLGHALRRFDERVLVLMARNVDVPLALSNLAARAQVGAAHIHITRHLAVGGSRLTDLAQSAGMSKQAMGDLVDQCEAWGLVTREADPHDARARRVCFTPTGLAWLQAFRDAVAQAEAEFREEVGNNVATVVAIGLEAYAGASGA